MARPAHAAWVRLANLEALLEESVGVAWTKATDIEKGERLRSSGGGAAPSLPTQRVFFRRLELLRGKLPEEFEVRYVGGPDLRILDDPPYVRGDRYILFLRRDPDRPGAYLRVTVDGRLRQVHRHFEPFVPGGPGDELRGLTRSQIKARIRPR